MTTRAPKRRPDFDAAAWAAISGIPSLCKKEKAAEPTVVQCRGTRHSATSQRCAMFVVLPQGYCHDCHPPAVYSAGGGSLSSGRRRLAASGA